MTAQKQTNTAKSNIKKTQHSLARSRGKTRAKPGMTGEGNYYRIILRPKDQFRTFRYHDVGDPGHALRLAGKRPSGSWDTQAWLISKDDAHLENEKLVPDTEDAKKIIRELGTEPKHLKADIFEAKDRPNIPESDKPTAAQRKARSQNSEKARQTGWN